MERSNLTPPSRGEKKALIRVIVLSTAAFAVILAVFFGVTALAAARLPARIDGALADGNVAKAQELTARLEDDSLKREYENKCVYRQGVLAMEAGNWSEAASLGKYADAPELRRRAVYSLGTEALEQGDCDGAIRSFEEVSGYADAAELARRAKYLKAEELCRSGNITEGFLVYYALGDYTDAAERALDAAERIVGRRDAEAALAAAESLSPEQIRKRDALALKRQALPRGIVCAGFAHTAALRRDGTVLACGSDEYGQCGVSQWKNVTMICAGAYHTAALLADGTVLAVGRDTENQCAVEGWTDVVAVAAADYATFALRADGTVLCCGYNDYSALSEWTDITALSGGSYAAAGLRSDGTALFSHESSRSEQMRDLAAVDVNTGYSLGLRADGTVVSTGPALDDWQDIAAVSAGSSAVLGLTADGRVTARFFRPEDALDFSDLRDIAAMDAGGTHYVFVSADGTVTARGDNAFGQCDTAGWDLF